MTKAVYAGSFDPITNGHLWMIAQGARLFDELVVAIGINPDKRYTFDLDTRLSMLRESVEPFDNVSVASFENQYLVNYAGDIGAGHIIRGQPGWDDVAAIRDLWEGPMLVKGVQKPEDAQRLAEMGIDAIWVSNHSGRQFDGGPSSISCLPAIREAVPDTPLVFDSGVTGGLDICRALALGADFVMLGRAFHYAVGALGEKGPPHLIEILKADMISNMGQMGAATLADLPACLKR